MPLKSRRSQHKSEIVGNEACPTCRNKGRDSTGDHKMLFADGGGYCNRCDLYFPPDSEDEVKSNKKVQRSMKSKNYDPGLSMSEVAALQSVAILDRGLTEKVVHHFGVKCALHETTREVEEYYFPVYRYGDLQGYKLKRCVQGKEKFKNKHVGKLASDCELFGQHACKGNKRRLIITEGQEDAMAAWLMLTRHSKGTKYEDKAVHAVSLMNGAQSAEAAIAANWSFLSKYETIYLALDNDEEGKKATKVFAKAFGNKNVLIISWDDRYKDPNDILKAGKKGQEEFISAYFNAKPYMPDGVVQGSSLELDWLKTPMEPGLSIPYLLLNDKLGGLRDGELTLLTGSPGCGKSTLARCIMNLLAREHRVQIGIIALEENLRKAALSQIALKTKVPYKELNINPDIISAEKWDKAKSFLDNYFTFIDNSFGSLDIDQLFEHLHFMVYNRGIKYILLDHINMVVSGTGGKYAESERELIDYLMTELAAFVTKTGAHIIAIVHLKRKEGKPFTKGAQITQSDLRGSGGLEQLAFNIIALSRNMLDEEESKYVTMSLLKNREGGELGFAGELEFDKDIGWYKPRGSV